MGARMPGNKYDLLRSRAQQASQAQEQEQGNAINRKFASMGREGSGAAIKVQRDIQDKSAQGLQNSMEGIGFQEAADQERKDEIEAGRKYGTSEREASQLFSRGEREGSQKYASGENAINRRFATSERLGSQQYAHGERIGAQGFATSERKGSQGFTAGQNKLARSLQDDQFRAQMEAQDRQWLAQFEEDKRVNQFNMDQANKKKKGMRGLVDPATRWAFGQAGGQEKGDEWVDDFTLGFG